MAAPGVDPLVHETRREIAEIVREVARAVTSQCSREEFLALLVDRVMRAMAAEGVLVWQRVDSPPLAYRCVSRLGRITDQSIALASSGTHQRMLVEVAVGGQPVVIPATPGATDAQLPANPTEVPAAVAPIDCERPSDAAAYLLEVFLEPQCGLAAQRGYLRFVAQMADLAGEFLRADQLRRLRREQTLARRVDTAVLELHQFDDPNKLAAAVADGAASLFGFDRVGVCRLEPKVVLQAVSHVSVIDAKSPAAAQIREAARAAVEGDGCLWLEHSEVALADEGAVVVRACIRFESTVAQSLVCLQCSDSEPLPSECRRELVRYARHAGLAIRSASQWDAIPGGRMLASLAPAISNRPAAWRRRAVMAALGTLGLLAALFPLPLVVDAPATIRPTQVRTFAAPRDCDVDEIHVRHGQPVRRGDKLLTLVDPALEEQLTDLKSRRAVKVQQQAHWTAALVDSASGRQDRRQLEDQQSLIAEEIRAIDDQLAMLQRVRDSLVIRADRDGIIDGWQMEHSLQSRPLRRGDVLLRVVAEGSPWMIEALVPQSRIAHLQDAETEQRLSARAALESDPYRSFDTALQQIGPVVAAGQEATASTAVLLLASESMSAMLASRHGTGHASGSPARVLFRCGSAPAAYLLLQDVIRSLRSSAMLYLPTTSDRSAEQGENR
jgi:multidrug efflux pump subunit AcrA (membrane-fusion protein)